MAKGWARQEAKTNELASLLEGAAAWAGANKRASACGGAAVLAVLALGGFLIYRHFAAREDAWGQFGFAQSFAYSGQTQQAIDMAKRMQEKHPGSLATDHARLLAADLLFQSEKYPEALSAYHSLLADSTDKSVVPLAMANVGLSQEAMGDCKSAVESDQKFLDSNQDHYLAPQVHASLARCLSALGQADKAKNAFERISFLYPDSAWAQWAKSKTKG